MSGIDLPLYKVVVVDLSTFVVVSVPTVVVAVSTVVVPSDHSASLWQTGEAARPPQSVLDHIKLSLLIMTAQSSLELV